jgi:type VI secretion system protein ImpD
VSDHTVTFDQILDTTQQSLAHQTTATSRSAQALAADHHFTPIDYFLREDDDIIAFEIWFTHFSESGSHQHQRLTSWLNVQIALLDEMLSEQLNHVLHHPKLQQLESGWRGLWYLIEAVTADTNIRLKFLDASWKDVSRDFERAADFDQSGLFHLVYNQEFGVAGGLPYSVLLGNYEVAHRPFAGHPYDDINTLKGLCHVAAASFAPFICGAAPQLFGIDDFDTLGLPIDLDNVFQQKEYLRWRSLRDMEDSRFLAITLPRVLLREPYTLSFAAYQGVRFKEEVEARTSHKYLWGNACFALGAVLIREFAEVGWFSHIRGAPRDFHGGGLVTQFPAMKYKTDSSVSARKMFTSVLITDGLERELSEHGFIPLCHCYDTPYAAFNSCRSLQRPKIHQGETAGANARISAMMQHILCASRIAQYIKVMARDKVGSYASAKDCERLLQHWLDQYTTGREDLSWEMMARYPLRQARVIVEENREKPGSYQSVIHLKCHYTVDHLVSELKLTTTLDTTGDWWSGSR